MLFVYQKLMHAFLLGSNDIFMLCKLKIGAGIVFSIPRLGVSDNAGEFSYVTTTMV